MKVERYIRVYYRHRDVQAYQLALPSDALTFLSTVDFLQNNDDPLLYCVYDLTEDQANYIYKHLNNHCSIDDNGYFDYQLDCERVESKVRTKEELFEFVEKDCTDFITSITGDSESSFGVPAAYKQDFWALKELLYKIYQQGVIDGRL